MTISIWWAVATLFIGATIGAFAMSLCLMARESDEQEQEP